MFHNIPEPSSGVSTIKRANNFDMSEYDRFANWVEKQRRCPKDALETAINQIDIKFVRSIMKGIDQTKGTPETVKKTDTEKAKAFLLKCYMTASMSLEVLDELSSYNFTGLSAEEIKKLLTKSIQLNMKQLRATDVLASKHVMLIARSLMKLLETFGHATRDVSWTMSTTDSASPNHPTTTIWSTMPSCQSIRNSRIWQWPLECSEA